MGTRWGNLLSIDAPPPMRLGIEAGHLADLRRAARQVRDRTGCSAWLDAWRLELCFGYADTTGGDARIALSFPIYRGGSRICPMRFDPVTDAVSVDDVCHEIMRARKTSMRVKERWRDAWRAREQHEGREKVGRIITDNFKAILDRRRFKYEKHAIGRHYRRSHLVSGLKPQAV